MEKLLTISIAAYNVDKFLENTLNSLLIENIKKIEIIIENDGSKDNTSSIGDIYVSRYPDSFVLINKQNGGYGSTINNSLKIAKGKYFKQLDGDDWFDTNNLDKLISLLDKIDDNCIFTPHLNYYEYTNKYELINTINKPEGVYEINEILKTKGYISMHDLMYKTDFLRKINFSMMEHCFYTDQEYVIYPMMYLNTIYIHSKPIYCYRLGLTDQSMSINGIKKHYKDHLLVIEKLLKYYDINLEKMSNDLSNYVMKRISNLIESQLDFYVIVGNEYKSCKKLCQIIKNNYPQIYVRLHESESKLTKLLLYSNCYLYYILSKYKNYLIHKEKVK